MFVVNRLEQPVSSKAGSCWWSRVGIQLPEAAELWPIVILKGSSQSCGLERNLWQSLLLSRASPSLDPSQSRQINGRPHDPRRRGGSSSMSARGSSLYF